MSRPSADLVSPDLVSIVIPTLDREQPLRRALASVLARTPSHDIDVEILVIDNSPDRSARWVVAEYGDGPVRYVSEPVRGIANARNAGVRAAAGRFIAFLDDDEEAGPDWIARHVATFRATGADASFGPVEAKAEEGEIDGAFAGVFSRRIDRAPDSDITDLVAYLGTNNSAFDRLRCFGEDDAFDASLNEVGGEDSLMLKRLAESGRKFAWSADARVVEWVPQKRLNWHYIRRRRFLSGQIRSFVHHKVSPPQWGRIAFWMAVGAAQAAAGFAAALLLRPVSRERSDRARAAAWGGLGKVFWGSRFGPRLYGSGLVS